MTAAPELKSAPRLLSAESPLRTPSSLLLPLQSHVTVVPTATKIDAAAMSFLFLLHLIVLTTGRVVGLEVGLAVGLKVGDGVGQAGSIELDQSPAKKKYVDTGQANVSFHSYESG